MKKKKTWMARHVTDPYVKKASLEGHRSRAAYKLLQLQEKDRMIQRGMWIVDLGAAPGGWSKVARDLVGEQGKVIALDQLSMSPIPGVEFIQGDFNDSEVFNQLMQSVQNRPIDLVISDLAPNLTGHTSIDQPRSMQLVELALDFAIKVLKKNGGFLVKIFQGEGSETFIRTLKSRFKTVRIRKPEASRPESREVYVLAQGFLGYNDDLI